MISLAKRLAALLTPSERRGFALTLLSATLAAIVQVASVGSIIPFVALLMNPDLIQSNAVLARIYEIFGFSNHNSFMMAAGLLVFSILVSGNALKTFTTWYMTKFVWNFQVRLSASLFLANLCKPHVVHISRNSTDIAKNILTESMQVAQGILLRVTGIVASGLSVLLLLGFLFWLSPRTTLVVIAVFGFAYCLIYFLVRRSLQKIGKRRFDSNSIRFKSVSHAFGSVKEVKLLGREDDFVRAYTRPANTYAHSIIAQTVLGLLPRYIVETLAFGTLVLILLVLIHQDASMRAFLPLASAFALAGYRVLPALQTIYNGVTRLKFNAPVLAAVEKDLWADAREMDYPPESRPAPLAFKQELRLEKISFTYPGAVKPAVQDIDFVIPRHNFVALVGQTGAGKTSIVDIILGLLSPESGRLLVDGTEINRENLRAWQANIGYVPQEIYLLDDTVAANIAFGLAHDQIDQAAVERAARIANIHDFIVESMPGGYQTVVGERGVRLSGGERQRIGIARALYHDPEVLVLDEATSALDSQTEAKVHGAVAKAAAVKTVIAIAHRLSTVKNCDCIYFLKMGRIIDRGAYDELCERNAEFRRIARTGGEPPIS